MEQVSLDPDDDPIITGEIPEGLGPDHIIKNVRDYQGNPDYSNARMPLRDLEGEEHDEDVAGIDIDHDPGSVVAFVVNHKKGITYAVTVAALAAGVAGITWVKRRQRD